MMNYLPLVSVITPSYNGGRFIPGYLKMLESQTYRNLEIVLVIDGLSDNSVALVEEFKKDSAFGERIRLIVNEINNGPSAARNSGLETAGGEFVHFLDVDDTINPEFYSNMVEALVDTGSDVACCGFIDEKRPYFNQIFRRRRTVTSERGKMTVTWVAQWGYSVRYLIRRGLLDENCLRFETGWLIEDKPFSIALLHKARKVVTVPGSVYTYVYVQSSIMNSMQDSELMHKSSRHTAEMMEAFSRENGIPLYGLRGFSKFIFNARKNWQIISRKQNLEASLRRLPAKLKILLGAK